MAGQCWGHGRWRCVVASVHRAGRRILLHHVGDMHVVAHVLYNGGGLRNIGAVVVHHGRACLDRWWAASGHVVVTVAPVHIPTAPAPVGLVLDHRGQHHACAKADNTGDHRRSAHHHGWGWRWWNHGAVTLVHRYRLAIDHGGIVPGHIHGRHLGRCNLDVVGRRRYDRVIDQGHGLRAGRIANNGCWLGSHCHLQLL